LAENIGRFMMVWNVLERELDGSFHTLFHTDPTLAMCLYANLQAKQKIDILSSAVTMSSEALGKRLTTTAHAILRRASVLSSEARNTVAHGQLRAFRETEDDRPTWQLVRHFGRKKATIVIHPGQSQHWAQQGKTTLLLAQRWRTCAAKMHLRLDHLSSDDLEEVCLTQIQSSKPSRIRRRRHPPPRKGGSVDRQARLARWPRT
jgi:hypothetical protein